MTVKTVLSPLALASDNELGLLGETRIIRIKILIIIIRAGTPLVSHSFNLIGNQNVLIPKFNIFWIPAQVEGTTDESGTSADYSTQVV